MKGRGDVQKWFYVEGAENARTLVRLGRNYGFPTEIVRRPAALPGYGIDP